MDELVEAIEKEIEIKKQFIVQHYQEDYQLMNDYLNQYIESDYNVEYFSELLKFNYLKTTCEKLQITQDAERYHLITKLDEMLSQDFLTISINDYRKIIETLNTFQSTLWSVEQFTTLQNLLSDDRISISKEPILESIEDKKQKISQLKESLLETLVYKIGLLKRKVEQKMYDYSSGIGVKSISLELSTCRDEIISLTNMSKMINSNELCADFSKFREVIQFIRNSSMPPELKQQSIKHFYVNTRKNLLGRIHREKIVVNESISKNADDVLGEINNFEDSPLVESDNKQSSKDEYLKFNDIIPVEILNNYLFEDFEKSIFQSMKDSIEEYLKNGIPKIKLHDEFMNDFVSVCSSDENYRMEYYMSDNKVNWDFVLVDLYQNKDDKKAILDICKQLLKAISIETKTKNLSNLYLARNKQLTEIRNNLGAMYEELMKINYYSQQRDELTIAIAVIQDQINEVDETDDKKFTEFIDNYNRVLNNYNEYIKKALSSYDYLDAKEEDISTSTNSSDDNLIIFSPNFIDQCRELHSVECYREIRKSLGDLSSKTRMSSLVKKKDKFKRGDKLNGYVAWLKTTNTVMFVSKINDNVWCVCGVSKKIGLSTYERKMKSTILYNSSFREEVKKWIESSTPEEIRRHSDNQMKEVNEELSIWDNEKGNNVLGGSDGNN